MATADEAINMLSEILLLDNDGAVTTLEYLTPAESLRRQADRIERKEALRERAWEMVRSHKSVVNK